MQIWISHRAPDLPISLLWISDFSGIFELVLGPSKPWQNPGSWAVSIEELDRQIRWATANLLFLCSGKKRVVLVAVDISQYG